MTFISDKIQTDALKEYGVSIQTEFWENHNIRIRSTDHSYNDDVKDGIILQKKYYRDGALAHIEKDFNPLIKYTYLGGRDALKSFVCPNCGYEASGADGFGADGTGKTKGGSGADSSGADDGVEGKKDYTGDGCPYCGASYNLEYADRKEGAQYFADRESKNTGYYIAALIICFAVCLPVSFLIVRATGRTFLFFDKLKAVVFGVVPALLLFYGFFVTHAFVITRLAERRYERQTELIRKFEKDLGGMGISLSTFYNNLYSELRYLLYGSRARGSGSGQWEEPDGVDALNRFMIGRKGLIDADLLECSDFQIDVGERGEPEIKLTVKLRVIAMMRDMKVMKADDTEQETLKPVDPGRRAGKSGWPEKICSERRVVKIRMRENRVVPDELHPGVNIIHCRGCGAPIDVTRENCEYCGQRINYKQRVYIV